MTPITRPYGAFECGECGSQGVWVDCNPEDATHVALPLDVSTLPAAVVERVAMHIAAHRNSVAVDDKLREQWPNLHVRFRFEYEDMARAAIAALAAALGEEG